MLDDFLNGTATEKQKYFLLQALVCEKLPNRAVDMAVRAGMGGEFKSASVGLQNVKLGKVPSALRDLVAMVRLSMPDFEIPEFLMPADMQRQAA
ncbi:hypothetical protein [Hymenobacter terricola]|uniref:hypothetical protein n=1 Tax=Hymenobacter terricola TaxID=2819236 RepID=UPI001B31488C|nr:hypothetical protein [Hymenobacter terricola]